MISMTLIDLKFFNFHSIPVSKWIPINYLCLNLVIDAMRIQKFKVQRGLMGKNKQNQLKKRNLFGDKLTSFYEF